MDHIRFSLRRDAEKEFNKIREDKFEYLEDKKGILFTRK
jgi:hypothetical protein